MRYRHILGLSTLTCLCIAATATAAITPSGGGLTLVQQGPVGASAPANLASGSGTPFSDGALVPAGIHDTPNLNDGNYGNSFSWISDGDADGWAGVSFGASQSLQALAFGRDNLGSFSDRTLGTYTIQFRNDGSTANDGGWSSIGTIDYTALVGGSGLVINPSSLDTSPSLRHAYNFTPVSATALRIVVPGGAADTAIDEIELYSSALPIVGPPATQGTIAWDGNDGDNFNGTVPNNLALVANGGTPFAFSEFGSGHLIENLNDGEYGNSQSWISGGGPSFAGIDLSDSGPVGGLHAIDAIAFGRDNRDQANGDNFDGNDRNAGSYTLQYTTLTNADATTLDTQDPATGWATIGILNYASDIDDVLGGDFTGRFRHLYQIGAFGGGPLVVGGIRILAPDGNAIDEIEIYSAVAVPEPSTLIAGILGAVGLLAVRSRKRMVV